MSAKLNAQLGDAATVGAIQPELTDVGFTWDLPSMPAARPARSSHTASAIARTRQAAIRRARAATSPRCPIRGVNEALADAVYRIRQLKPVKVYAQWEIARFLVSKYGMGTDVLSSIGSVIASDGTIVYLSTAGVAAEAVSRAGGAAAMAASRWSVIGITRSAASRPRNRRA